MGLQAESTGAPHFFGKLVCLSMIYDKVTLEKRARVTLEEVCKYAVDSLICTDKPDLQDVERSYGVEVVEDCYPNEKKAERFIVSVWDKELSEVSLQKIRRFHGLGGLLKQTNGRIVSASLGPSTPNNPAHLIRTIQGKIDKLNNGGYKTFRTYGLYVFVNTVFLFTSYVQGVIEQVSEYQATMDSQYEVIYLDGYYEMYVCDIKTKTFSRIEMNQKTRERISEKILCHD